ncbi:hypothetical protein ERJ70_11400 [Sediminibacillus dalangtanensis]|uniref:DUF4190 domain-containing protein n=1 Tax=Sediminibacillus dalangtanensis TaxID=2729421 RepID=A0ABX7VSD3_9BACI|nr:DUF4190 domain-containing protein [Sediminibacillus dalangtanensis]QTM99846.1 hypothetical protein ERJ70_11400 [Sediminibacillus dalangtanensis]
MDEYSNKKQQNEEVEDAPKFGDDTNDPIITQQQGGSVPPRDPHEQYILDEPYKRDEEMAQELTATEFNKPIHNEEKETKMDGDVQTGFGWVAVILGVLSFFMMPVVLGAAAIIFGFISRNRGAHTLGNTAIIAGAVSIILTLFLAPFV